ncbi:MAG: RDD family protein [Bdellovibrionia bacterium]
MSNNDPFEEFEFKPLTEGLGFHKKKAETPKEDAPLIDPILKDQVFSLLDEEPQGLKSPLPRKGQIIEPTLNLKISETNEVNTTVDEILKNIQKNKRFEVEENKITSPAQQKEEFQQTSLSLSAGLLDGMLVVAASLLCMIILLVITRVDLIGSLTNPASDKMIYLATVGLFASVYLVYMLVNRVFLGYTPGEWAFDHRVGTPEDLKKWDYPLKVLARSVLNIVTGFILIPILSSIFKKDFAGAITGSSLVKKV